MLAASLAGLRATHAQPAAQGTAQPTAKPTAQPAARAASPPEEGPTWASLPAAQRTALAPLQGEWPGIDASRKRKWLEVASQFSAMTPDERGRVQVRMAEWARISPAERGRARLQFQESRQLSAQDRQARWEAYQALPPAERDALAAKAAPTPKKAAPATRDESRAPTSTEKRNVIASPAPQMPTKAVSPTVVQARPGATTTLISKPASPPAHHQTGLPKIAATKGFVDPATLLPKRGPQGAAIAAAPSGSAPGSKQP